jgi:hypothetical protein
MLAVGGGARPVPDGAHDTAGDQGGGRITREDREDRSDGHADHNERDVEGMPGVCHGQESSSGGVTVVVLNGKREVLPRISCRRAVAADDH